MTPFGERVRALRRRVGMTQAQLAAEIGVSPAYLSALEHGRRGRPGFVLIQGVIQALGVIWDEADDLVRLAELSDPRVTIDTGGLAPEATRLANRLARYMARLDASDLAALHAALDQALARPADPATDAAIPSPPPAPFG
jgi:transcriptional regulator with XRE-family HTH domain